MQVQPCLSLCCSSSTTASRVVHKLVPSAPVTSLLATDSKHVLLQSSRVSGCPPVEAHNCCSTQYVSTSLTFLPVYIFPIFLLVQEFIHHSFMTWTGEHLNIKIMPAMCSISEGFYINCAAFRGGSCNPCQSY